MKEGFTLYFLEDRELTAYFHEPGLETFMVNNNVFPTIWVKVEGVDEPTECTVRLKRFVSLNNALREQ